MARLVFGMNQSLDGYVDHMEFAPGPTLFRHFIEEALLMSSASNSGTRRPARGVRAWSADRGAPDWRSREE